MLIDRILQLSGALRRCATFLKKINQKKRLSFWESLLKNEWVTYFLLGNGDGFGHDFLAINHLDFLLHLFVD